MWNFICQSVVSGSAIGQVSEVYKSYVTVAIVMLMNVSLQQFRWVAGKFRSQQLAELWPSSRCQWLISFEDLLETFWWHHYLSSLTSSVLAFSYMMHFSYRSIYVQLKFISTYMNSFMDAGIHSFACIQFIGAMHSGSLQIAASVSHMLLGQHFLVTHRLLGQHFLVTHRLLGQHFLVTHTGC